MLELIDVRKVYTTKAGDTVALKGVSIKFADKGLVFISGKSGCGKTTLLNTIGGLDKIDGGEIIVDGKKFSEFTPADYDSYRNTMVGFVFQEYNLLNEYTIEKNINIADELQGRKTDTDKLKGLLRKFEIETYEKRKPNQLSGGQKQRVAITRALIKNPKIILADEPTGALDSVTGIQVMDMLKELSKDKLVIVVSHENSFAEKYADRIIRIIDGEVVEDVTLNDIDIKENVYDGEEEIIVKSGTRLNESETEKLVDAVESKKKIRLTEKITIRQKKKTGEIEDKGNQEPVTFIKSRMKFKSVAGLGMKSLVVKPFRLIITILLSVIAFAVFGVFDSVASYNGERALSKLLSGGEYKSVAVYNNYSSDNYSSANLKMSQSYINKLNKETGYSFRGVYEIDDSENSFKDNVNYSGDRRENFNVGVNPKEVSVTYSNKAKEYYSYNHKLNGIVEFGWSDLSSNGMKIKGYNYKIIPNTTNSGFVPVYPVLAEEGKEQSIGISKYYAEYLRFWASQNAEKGYDGTTIKDIEDLYGKKLTLNGVEYKISAIIDCGTVPEKYQDLKKYHPTDKSLPHALAQDFTTYLNASCNLCLFAPKGYVNQMRATNKRVTSYVGNYNTVYYKAEVDASKQEYRLPVFYNVKEFTNLNTIFFNDTSENGTDDIVLARNEALISYRNLTRFLYDQDIQDSSMVSTYVTALNYSMQEDVYQNLPDDDTDTPDVNEREVALNQAIQTRYNNIKDAVQGIVQVLKTNYQTFNHIKTLRLTAHRYGDNLLAEPVLSKDFNVVGVYFDVNVDEEKFNQMNIVEPLVLSESGLQSIKINTNQGYYSRAISTVNTKVRSANKLSAMMSKETGNKLVWFENGVLQILEEYETDIVKVVDLFLYIAIVMMTFSIFMLFNYISTSIVSKRQSIGVLRALGTGGKSVFLMFLLESLVISIISGLLASLVSYIACLFINSYILEVMNLTIKFVLFGGRQIALIVASSVATGCLASLIPIIRIVKEKPVALIRKD